MFLIIESEILSFNILLKYTFVKKHGMVFHSFQKKNTFSLMVITIEGKYDMTSCGFLLSYF